MVEKILSYSQSSYLSCGFGFVSSCDLVGTLESRGLVVLCCVADGFPRIVYIRNETRLSVFVLLLWVQIVC